ncbi:MAG: secretin N-terminal domain-containing protein [Verrucomicrobiota bacterium]|nr:secretin N-terminal domain-containing protein [Verrucomicrobiota bacterium]
MKFLTTGLLTFALVSQQLAQQPPNPPTPPVPPAPAVSDAAAEEVQQAEDAPLAMDDVIPMADLQLVNMPIEQFLKIYADYVNRTILRQAALPNLNVTLEAQTPLTVEEAIQAMDSVLSLNGYTTIPVGEKFITFVPSANALQEGAAFSTVTSAAELPEANQFITHISQLKHILPSEAVPMLTPMAKNPAGIVALDVSKTLVLRDNSSNIKRMLELLERIDIKPDEDFKLKVIPIRYGKVEEIYSSMQELITGSGGGARPSSSSSRTSPTSRTSSSRTSSSSRATPQQNRTSTASNSSSSSFRSRLQSIVNRASGGDIQILENARIVPDYRSNSLIVFANDRDMAKIDEIVQQVDSILAQVLIEAIIVNVTLSDGMDTGVNILMNEAKGSNPNYITGSLNGGPSTIINTPAPAAPNNPGQGGFGEGGGNGGANTAAEVAGNAVGTFSSSMLSGGFSYLSRYDSGLDFAMSALAQNSSAKVMQTPRVQTSHAVPATFFNGEQVPYQGSSGYGGSYGGYGGAYGGYGGSYGGYTQFLNVGITLDVTPYITPDDLVVMEISQTISELEGFIDMGGGQADGAGMKAPQTTEREATSTISVKDGDTILLGGFIRSAKTDTESGVPFLKDVPLLGNLFKNNSKTSKRSELLVLIRPTILDTPEEAALMSVKERKRLPGVREAEAEFTEDERKRMLRVERKLGNGVETEVKTKPASPPGRKTIVNPVY